MPADWCVEIGVREDGSGDVEAGADAADRLGGEFGERSRFDARGPECAPTGTVLADLAAPVEDLGGDVSFGHCRLPPPPCAMRRARRSDSG